QNIALMNQLAFLVLHFQQLSVNAALYGHCVDWGDRTQAREINTDVALAGFGRDYRYRGRPAAALLSPLGRRARGVCAADLWPEKIRRGDEQDHDGNPNPAPP